MRRMAGSVLLVSLLGGGAAAQLSDFEAQRAAAHKALIQSLGDYAGWCEGKKLFQERQKAFELVLSLEPGNADAQKGLGYTREKDGTWKPPAKPKTLHDFDQKALEEAPARLKAASTGYVSAMSRCSTRASSRASSASSPRPRPCASTPTTRTCTSSSAR